MLSTPSLQGIPLIEAMQMGRVWMQNTHGSLTVPNSVRFFSFQTIHYRSRGKQSSFTWPFLWDRCDGCFNKDQALLMLFLRTVSGSLALRRVISKLTKTHFKEESPHKGIWVALWRHGGLVLIVVGGRMESRTVRASPPCCSLISSQGKLSQFPRHDEQFAGADSFTPSDPRFFFQSHLPSSMRIPSLFMMHKQSENQQCWFRRKFTDTASVFYNKHFSSIQRPIIQSYLYSHI